MALRELPILFNGRSVRSILRKHKTETRRAIKPQPEFESAVWSYAHKKEEGHSGIGWYCAEEEYPDDGSVFYGDPYGAPGDILWVRESAIIKEIKYGKDGKPMQLRIIYLADSTEGVVEYPTRLRGSLVIGRHLAYGCYKEAHRIRLRIVKKWPQRLQEIDHAGVEAEGYPTPLDEPGGSKSFCQGWNEINGKRFPYDSNPWVWAVRFELAGVAKLPQDWW
jgi:hypothetical protein